ncbi:MAG: hypothetical protein LBP27_02615, partial [Treponema sp.]|nr:hypothetical protein [Treponema sp.]
MAGIPARGAPAFTSRDVKNHQNIEEIQPKGTRRRAKEERIGACGILCAPWRLVLSLNRPGFEEIL